MQAGFTLAHPIFIVVAAGTLICVFLRAAAHKFFDFSWFSHILAEYRILPAGLAMPAAGLLAVLELAVSLGLVLPQARPVAAAGAAGLLLLYAAAIAVNLLRGRSRIDCGCGGAGQGLSWFLVARNVALTALALIAGQNAAAVDFGALGWLVAAASIASFWLLIVGTEKLAENLSYLAAADDSAHQHDHHLETH
jgi:hypothetical protein